MNQEYVSALAKGYAAPGDEIILSFYGPKGGNRGLECLSPQVARKLAADLLAAADRLEQVPA